MKSNNLDPHSKLKNEYIQQGIKNNQLKILRLMEKLHIDDTEKNKTNLLNSIQEIINNPQENNEIINDDLKFEDIYKENNDEIKSIDNDMTLNFKPKKSIYDIYKLIRK